MTNTAYQDNDVHHPRIRLRALLALLRVLAGRRGWSRVTWSGQGFIYTLRVVRRSPVPYAVDVDDDADPTGDAHDMLHKALS